VGGLWKQAWGFDWLYDKVFVQPYLFIARINARDWLDTTFNLLPWLTVRGNHLLVMTQSGKLRWYVATMVIGLVVVTAAFFFGLQRF
jgi:NADH-quinone oxidoreductase subunit L